MNINSFNIENEYPQLNNKKILLAVSGGLDSMTLLHLFSLTKLCSPPFVLPSNIVKEEL